ncbi:hypothetical protein HCN44_008728 [Aphidius gifuensis]|uniref:Uncharacterized protein n=1 Tax=Aphidius gifuensis TaxID=684658 RepID=A0A835CW39_APHGI|nr:hypothetical protein HCN44_008728 [Aphidius gifuensis]
MDNMMNKDIPIDDHPNAVQMVHQAVHKPVNNTMINTPFNNDHQKAVQIIPQDVNEEVNCFMPKTTSINNHDLANQTVNENFHQPVNNTMKPKRQHIHHVEEQVNEIMLSQNSKLNKWKLSRISSMFPRIEKLPQTKRMPHIGPINDHQNAVQQVHQNDHEPMINMMINNNLRPDDDQRFENPVMHHVPAPPVNEPNRNFIHPVNDEIGGNVDRTNDRRWTHLYGEVYIRTDRLRFLRPVPPRAKTASS